ncbi:MAG TPA: AbrB/MazE/SpoVT family DNA-binding domain-containing protein [Syntrophothermus lipocalidus]|uniref:Transcriptional regulator, AbrB family n=1 Tax=Syntrophothermus lipocalidus (strain DSM 12680 / TGB-C1) TaxID=643648 RepID=D7CJA2_SYNLT|nr:MULTISPECIES: AbrB/MazE/SpoVT family DNA-binding domain-containing protein [Syntrophothermus]ADI00991.1 transcriptional regulator, AbrB family [Syntrophothermus lipocalidus DSM 12680]ADI01001.1 transcriptional regulator, AbrB family [Syntrophothermus lipocalidus DSM 12680]NSW81667.1 AbrB/MazE/SpoVT family DNA-binding domain-containing protein [Syntrophothermus sp.]HHV77689.1 AbrB/MazE/SpoVT family DNA-binding domain-containing protein [Syntrophothermus lipocalidus]
MSVVKISKKGQVTIPAEIRKVLGAAPGTRLRFVVQGDSVQVVKADEGIAALRGSVKVSEAQDFLAVRQQVMEEVAREVAGEGEDD